MTSGASQAGHDRPYVRDPDFVFRRIADEIVLIPIRKNMGDLESIYTLNDVGARVWELIDGRRTARDLRDAIVAEYEVTPERAAADVAAFLGRLRDIGALRPEANA
jgi:hypothetical protein